MKQTAGPAQKPSAEAALRDIRRAMRRRFSAEGKTASCRTACGARTGSQSSSAASIAPSMSNAWSEDFPEAGKKRPAGDTAPVATSDEVRDLRRESGALKEVVADFTLGSRLLRKA